jgi:hypothetical protein
MSLRITPELQQRYNHIDEKNHELMVQVCSPQQRSKQAEDKNPELILQVKTLQQHITQVGSKNQG